MHGIMIVFSSLTYLCKLVVCIVGDNEYLLHAELVSVHGGTSVLVANHH